MYQSGLILVIKDLWYFIVDEYRQFFASDYSQQRLLMPVAKQYLKAPSGSVLLPSKRSLASESFVDNTHQTVLDSNKPKTKKPSPVETVKSEQLLGPKTPPTTRADFQVQYVLVAGSVCSLTPQQDYDTVLERFPYGTALVVTSYQGEYAAVWFCDQQKGWVRKDDLTPHRATVWPLFINGITYNENSESVKKLRLLIADSFNAGTLGLPLQAGEWVMYRLREQNRYLPWPVTYGRISGNWQNLLRGRAGIHIGIIPKTDSIMEWRDSEGVGLVAYVESVSPALTITISVVGYEELGCYEERVLVQAVWRELRPVFIEVV